MFRQHVVRRRAEVSEKIVLGGHDDDQVDVVRSFFASDKASVYYKAPHNVRGPDFDEKILEAGEQPGPTVSASKRTKPRSELFEGAIVHADGEQPVRVKLRNGHG